MNRLGEYRTVAWATALARTAVGAGLFVLVLQATACGDDGKESAASPSLEGQDAVNACDALVSANCTAKMRCGSMLSDAECREDAKNQGLDCPRAVRARVDYQRCADFIAGAPCSGAEPPEYCMRLVVIGPPLPPPPASFGPCFQVTEQLNDCNAYCASVGSTCAKTCQFSADAPPVADLGAAGLEWSDAALCPQTEKSTVVLECDWKALGVVQERRCCCLDKSQ
jgi:hypothetical protein